jgi:iron only hydrogenase large subunit-like protein
MNKLKFPLKGKYVAMVAPSFIVDFPYPGIIHGLKLLGFDKVVELTFGAKLVNKEYHKILENSNELKISSVCPGIAYNILRKYPNYRKNLINIDSPMMATSKVCRKIYQRHRVVFISPCNYKKIEAKKSRIIDFVIDYKELKKIFDEKKINLKIKQIIHFDKFYNDYTKIYPISGGLSETIHLKRILKKEQTRVLEGIKEVFEFLEKPDKKIKFLDCTFCVGGCVGGPCVNSTLSINKRRNQVLNYLKKSKQEDIPESRKGLIRDAKGISLVRKF